MSAAVATDAGSVPLWRRFNWRRALAVMIVVQLIQQLWVQPVYGQALLRTFASPGRMNGTVARIMENRLLRIGVPANDLAATATMAGLGGAAADLAVSAGIALVAGTPIGWGSILLGAVLTAGLTYALGAGDEAKVIPSVGTATIVHTTQWPMSFPVLRAPIANTPLVYSVNGVVGSDKCWGSVPDAAISCYIHAQNTRVRIQPNQSKYYIVGAGYKVGSSWSYRVFAPSWQSTINGGINPAIDTIWSVNTDYFDGSQPCQQGIAVNKQCEDPSQYNPITMGGTPKDTSLAPYSMPDDDYAKDAEPARIAELTNKLWEKAAAKPNYHGVPYTPNDPITTADAQADRAANPDKWPKVADWATPVAPGAIAGSTAPQVTIDKGVSPGTDPVSNPTPASQAPKVDLGPDPGVAQPTLEAAPSADSIISPLFNMFPGIKSLTVPTGGTCPTDTVDVMNWHIVLDQHCALIENYRAVIGGVMLAVWTMAAAIVLLRA